ncbi:CUBN [Bugula neritina]|uniref:CUBN n=1 Tax=Bugula neritina TaxID=10212 RepID=A0A7J7IZ37_BUGNE|nr:CUBN [Bugula neritina]
MHLQKLFIVVASCCLSLTTGNNRVKRQSPGTPPQQPRIVTTDGHLVFQTGANHNISFQSSSGGSVNIDGTDIKTMSQKVDLHQTKLQSLEGIPDQVAQQGRDLDLYKFTVADQFSEANSLLRNHTQQIRQMNRSISNTRTIDRLKRKVRTLQTNVETITETLRNDNCASGPCHNGGTCIDMYDGYRCFCPVNWQGTTCNEDVNECAIFQGTAQGCHSGATCNNLNGGFSCVCPDAYTGVLCNVREGHCSEGSDSEICGHGSCYDSGDTHNCVCEDGWTKDTAGRCTVDINECDQADHPCHQGVLCINTPGAFHCGVCPAGFTGSGFRCDDINECLSLNGGCSINPLVECTNTIGSRICGACPAGYEKTPSEACVWVGICNTNNGGCHPNAQCYDNPALPVRSCRCNPGYTGNGEGSNGCVPTEGGVTPNPDPCSPNPCRHGNCFTLSNSNVFTCSCLEGWTGHLCDTDINECESSICQNGGTCTNTPGNYTCACTEYAVGRNCETPTFACGGELTGETGSFAFPPSNHDAYPHDVSCAWRITTTLNHILKVTFTRFSLERHTNCEYDFLQIHDGGTASAHQIGKYCGNDTLLGLQGKTITTTHNRIYMWFKADQSINDQGFAFTWRSEIPQCGFDVRNATIGTIASPGYPGNYPTSRTCIWTVRVAPGNTIQVTAPQIEIEHHANCSYDYLEFRSGLRDNDPLIERVCSQRNHTLINSDGNELYVKFHSDASLTDSGFQLTWTAQPDPRGCGGVLNLTDGTVISPNYPNHYDHTAECDWIITVPQNARIALNFTDFQLESSSTCAYDYLEIYDGPDDTSDSFGRFCGTQLPALVTSTTNFLYLKFRTDSSVNSRGFSATWTIACGGLYTEQTGVITSPYWPDSYPHAKVCRYMLSARENQLIEVSFSHFGVESSNNDGCTYDSLVAYDGQNAQSELIRRMCGTAIPEPLISTGPNMLIVFTSDGSITDVGFRATYEFRNTTIPIIPATVVVFSPTQVVR